MFSVARFVIYGLSGWCIEVIWTGLGSLIDGDIRLTAQTYLWMFPIYGLVMFLEPVHDRMRARPWFLRGFVWMTLFFSIEYITGWLLRQIVGQSPWNYYQAPLHLHGLIRFDYAPAWFAAGFLFERVHDFLRRRTDIGI